MIGVITRTIIAVIYGLLGMALDVIGLLAVPLAISFASWQPSPIVADRMILNAPRWLWIWGNDEEGFRPIDYTKLHPTWPQWWLSYQWAAIRNPTDNLRFVRWLNPPQRADAVQWRTFGKWTFIWQGWLCRWVWNWANYDGPDGSGPYLTFGWKYSPEKQDSTGWQAHGIGFQIRRGS